MRRRWRGLRRTCVKVSSDHLRAKCKDQNTPTSVLIDRLQLTSHRAEGLCWVTVAVYCTHDVRPGLVHGNMDRKASRVHGVHVARLHHNAFFVHETQVLGLHPAERFGKGINPKVVQQNGVSDSDVATSTFVVVAILAQPPKCRCLVKLDEFSFYQLVAESGYANLSNRGFLCARDRVRTIDKPVQRPVFGMLFDLS